MIAPEQQVLHVIADRMYEIQVRLLSEMPPKSESYRAGVLMAFHHLSIEMEALAKDMEEEAGEESAECDVPDANEEIRPFPPGYFYLVEVENAVERQEEHIARERYRHNLLSDGWDEALRWVKAEINDVAEAARTGRDARVALRIEPHEDNSLGTRVSRLEEVLRGWERHMQNERWRKAEANDESE